ncbi:MAG TPA: branched-chain amino acid ABC transporter permease [Actinomycetes bacterium]|jgi:branched-chain amino acid transport system permease protein|nr:branched-chain amino acid ABC transporter permease [Actinomycetes bacterium]
MSGHLLAQALVNGILLGLVYTVMALGLSLIMGVMGIVNLAHSAFIMLGSFLALELLQYFHIDPMISFVVAIPVFFAVGVVVYRLLVRRVEHASDNVGLLVLFGLMVVIESTAILIWTTDTRVVTVGYSNVRLGIGPLTLSAPWLIVGAAALLLVAALHGFIRYTLTGRAMRAIAQSRDAAAVLGIDVARLSTAVFGLGIASAAAGGVALALIFPFAPQQHVQWLSWSFLVVIIGGLGGVGNTLIAGIMTGVVQTVLGAVLPFNLVYLAMYLLLATLMVVRSGALGGTRKRAL